MAQYKIGTVDVTNGSNIVTGTGTVFLTNVTAGNWFALQDGNGLWYTVASVDSDTQIQLTAPWAGTTQTGIAYAIVIDFSEDGVPFMFNGDVESPGVYNEAVKRIASQTHVKKTTVTKVDSVEDFYGLAGTADGQQVSLTSWHSGLGKGGGIFYWDSTGDKADHNGCTTIATDIQYVSVSQYLTAVGSGTGVWRRLLSEYGTPEMAGAVGDGVDDDYLSIQTALNIFPLTKLSDAVYLISQGLDLPNFRQLMGVGHDVSSGVAEVSVIKKGGDFDGVTINAGCYAFGFHVDGNGQDGDGIYQKQGRSTISDISSFNNLQDGFKIGGKVADPTANTNIFRAYNLIARGNTRHGVFVSQEGATTTPDCNAGLISGLDATGNGGDGLAVGEAIDNQFFGISAQTNTGHGVRCYQYALGNYITAPYTELNTAGGVQLDSGADRNYLFGYRSGGVNDEIVNNGDDNIIIGRYGSIDPIPLHSAPEAFENIKLLERSTSGLWALSKEATTRNLLIDLESTTADANIIITGSGGGDVGFGIEDSGTDDAVFKHFKRKSGTTINFGTVPANSSTDISITIDSPSITTMYVVMPLFVPPTGTTFCTIWSGSNILVRCTNATGTGVAVSGAFTVIGLNHSAL